MSGGGRGSLGGRPTLTAAEAVAHVDHLVSTCAGVTPTHAMRVAGAGGAFSRLRKPGARAERATIDRLLALTPEHFEAFPPPRPPVPIDKARAHVLRIMEEAGASPNTIARAVGTSHQTLYVVAGLRAGVTQKTIMAATEEAILAVTVEDVRAERFYADERWPTVTRIRALEANGWDLVAISAMAHVNASRIVRDDRALLMRHVEHRIKVVYDRIGDRKGPSEIAAKYARKIGYRTPIHYDDDMVLIKPATDREADAQDRARRDLCIVGLTVAEDGPASAADLAHILGVTQEGRVIIDARRSAGLRVFSTREGAADLVERVPGAIARARAATVDIDCTSVTSWSDRGEIDYVEVWRSLCAASTPTAADVAA